MTNDPSPSPPVPPQKPQQLSYATPAVMPGAVVCPQCGRQAARPARFTWWGGIIGPRLLHHHKCHACGYTFNGKTCQPNTTGIIIYTVAIGSIAVVMVVLAVAAVIRFHMKL